MDGTLIFKTAIGAIALATLGGSIAPALAESAIESAAAQVSPAAASDLPRFAPSVPESSDGTLVEFDPSAAETLDAGTADLAGIEPAAEPPAREIGAGVASWYGSKFAGRKTASGERFDPGQYTAAHRTLPFGSRVRVSHGGKSVVVRINDRGPFHGNRVIDLSQAAAAELGLVHAGSGRVELSLING